MNSFVIQMSVYFSETNVVAARNTILSVISIPLLFALSRTLVVIPSTVIFFDLEHLLESLSLSINAAIDGFKILPYGIVPCILLGLLLKYGRRSASYIYSRK